MATDLLVAQPIATDLPPHENPAAVNDQPDASDAKTPSATAAEMATAASIPKPFVRDLIELTKPRIVTMILVTTVATAMIGAGGWVSPVALVWLLLGTAMVAGSAGAANQVWERVIDRNMTRTASRPLPGQRMTTTTATTFTLVIGVLGTVILWNRFGSTPALAGVATWMLYVLVYTPMKTRTSLNTTVGAVAGALPVLIGYTACGGELTDACGWLLVGVLGAWQYPHFMAIAWLYRRQYDEAGFKMSTTVEPTGISAGIQAVIGSLAVIGCGTTLCFLPGQSWFAYVAAVIVVAAVFPMLRASVRFLGKRDDFNGRKLLLSSLWVLPAVLMVITIRVFW